MVSYHADDPSTTKSKSVELLERVKKILRRPSIQRSKMKLIDTIQRLGVGHHFEEEIRLVLEGFADYGFGENLFNTALCFRLMRHNGFPTSSGGKILHQSILSYLKLTSYWFGFFPSSHAIGSLLIILTCFSYCNAIG